MNYLPSLRTLRALRPDWASLSTLGFRRVRRFLAAILPQRCELCRAYGGDWPVCPDCNATLPRIPDKHCPRCADTSATGNVCARCLTRPELFETTIAAFAYAPPIDDLIHALKYGHQLNLANWFGHGLADALSNTSGLDAATIVAVPLHPARLSERGFNQATEIARPLARRLGVSIAHETVRRVRATPAQAQLALADREHNVRDAFQCSRDLTGRTLIVVDDVMTSGASIRELCRVLRLHGAERIIVAVAARTLHD